MKFIQLTDTHLRKDDTASDMEHIFKQLPNPANHLRKVLRETPWEDKDFVVITGDLIHEGCSQDYAYLKEILDNELPKDIPILYTLGNHDHKEAFYEGIFQEKCSKPYYYTQECSGFRLVVLDSAIPKKESGTLCQEQLRWLKELLKTKAPKGAVALSN